MNAWDYGFGRARILVEPALQITTMLVKDGILRIQIPAGCRIYASL